MPNLHLPERSESTNRIIWTMVCAPHARRLGVGGPSYFVSVGAGYAVSTDPTARPRFHSTLAADGCRAEFWGPDWEISQAMTSDERLRIVGRAMEYPSPNETPEATRGLVAFVPVVTGWRPYIASSLAVMMAQLNVSGEEILAAANDGTPLGDGTRIYWWSEWCRRLSLVQGIDNLDRGGPAYLLSMIRRTWDLTTVNIQTERVTDVETAVAYSNVYAVCDRIAITPGDAANICAGTPNRMQIGPSERLRMLAFSRDLREIEHASPTPARSGDNANTSGPAFEGATVSGGRVDEITVPAAAQPDAETVDDTQLPGWYVARQQRTRGRVVCVTLDDRRRAGFRTNRYGGPSAAASNTVYLNARRVREMCNGGPRPEEVAEARRYYFWLPDWNNRVESFRRAAARRTVETQSESTGYLGRQLPGIYVRRTRQRGDRVTVVGIVGGLPGQAVSYNNAGNAAAALNIPESAVVSLCNGAAVSPDLGPEILSRISESDFPAFFWHSDWALRANSRDDWENRPRADNRGHAANVPVAIVRDGREIGQITRCGQGYFAKIKTQRGHVHHFDMALENVRRWSDTVAENAAPDEAEDDHASPEPETIRQPNR